MLERGCRCRCCLCANCSTNQRPVVSYVATTSLTELSFDLTDFIDDAKNRGINSASYLTNIFAGFEIWSGGANMKTNDFCAIVE